MVGSEAMDFFPHPLDLTPRTHETVFQLFTNITQRAHTKIFAIPNFCARGSHKGSFIPRSLSREQTQRFFPFVYYGHCT